MKCVLSPVQLDNHSSFEADKINNSVADGLLPSEFQPIKLSCLQVLPKKPLSVGRALSQHPGYSREP
jgi:hypothetical protein